MGVWNPTDRWELFRAVQQQRYVDAYTVGESQVKDGYQKKDLRKALRYIKVRTGKPVAVSALTIANTTCWSWNYCPSISTKPSTPISRWC
jgi:hypothetical protein